MADELIEKRLPFSMPAEQSLLGAVLIDPVSLNEIAALMKGEDFYLEEHKQIYLAMQELFLANREILLVTTMSIFPALQSAIMRLNSSRFLVLVPVMPLSG